MPVSALQKVAHAPAKAQEREGLQPEEWWQAHRVRERSPLLRARTPFFYALGSAW